MDEMLAPESDSFDWSQCVPETREILQEHVDYLRSCKTQTVMAVGAAVHDAKRLLPHGELEGFVKHELGVSPGWARRCLRVMHVLGPEPTSTLNNMGTNTLFLIASEGYPSEALTLVLCEARSGPVTLKRAEDIKTEWLQAQNALLSPREDQNGLGSPICEPAEPEAEAEPGVGDDSEWQDVEYEDVDEDVEYVDIEVADFSVPSVSFDDLIGKLASFPAHQVMRALWDAWDATQRVSARAVLDTPQEGERSHFEDFWSVYPPKRKRDKKKAKEAWNKAIKEGADPDAIIAAAQDYARSDEGNGEFCAGPVPWLNGGRWEDDRSSWNSTSTNAIAGYLQDGQ